MVDSAAAGRHVYKKSAEIFSAVVSVFTIFSSRLNTVHRVLLNKPNQTSYSNNVLNERYSKSIPSIISE